LRYSPPRAPSLPRNNFRRIGFVGTELEAFERPAIVMQHYEYRCERSSGVDSDAHWKLLFYMRFHSRPLRGCGII